MNNPVMGMVEYTPEGWQRLREVSDDVPLSSFAEQRKKVARIAREFERQGCEVRWLHGDVYYVDELVSWCRRDGFRVDQRARAAFGAHWQASESESEW